MKFLIDRTELRAAISQIGSLIRRSQTIAILSNFHIIASGGGIRITATNLDIQASALARTRVVEEEGETTLPADKLAQIVESLAEGADILFEMTPGEPRVIVKSGRSVFKVPALPAADFPMLRPTLEGDIAHAFTVKAPAMLRLIEHGAFVMGDDKAQAYLNCGFLVLADTSEGQVMRMVSTDRKSFAVCDSASPAEELPSGLCAKLTPETVKILASTLKGQEGELAVTITPGRVVFAMERIGIIAKQMDGTYIEYERVIPTAFDFTMTVDTDLMTALIRRAMIMSSSQEPAVKLVASPDGKLMASGNDVQTGGVSEDWIDCTTETKVDFKIVLNAARVLVALALVETENVVLSVATRTNVVLFEPTGDADWFAFIGQMAG
jgi:DNA polymerase-3 subunit beta